MLQCDSFECDLNFPVGINDAIPPLTIRASGYKNPFDTPGGELRIAKGSPEGSDISHFPVDLEWTSGRRTSSTTDALNILKTCSLNSEEMALVDFVRAWITVYGRSLEDEDVSVIEELQHTMRLVNTPAL